MPTVSDLIRSHSTRANTNDTSYVGEKEGDIVESVRKYGVEIECYAPDGEDLEKVMGQTDGLVYKHDGSLNHNGVEIITPPISGDEGEKLVEGLSALLIDNNFYVDRTCGYHLHIDFSDVISDDYTEIMSRFEQAKKEEEKLQGAKSVFEFGDEEIYNKIKERCEEKANERRQLQREMREVMPSSSVSRKVKYLVGAYIALEGVISSFVPTTRRTNRYSRQTARNYSLNEVLNANDITDLEKLHYNSQDYRQVARAKNSGHSTRYRGINFHTMFSDGHYEIRLHSGTINAKKILHWANLHTAMADIAVEYPSRLQRLANEVSQTPNLLSATKLMFEALELSEKTQKYLLARQRKFAKADNLYGDLTIEELLDGEMSEGELSAELTN